MIEDEDLILEIKKRLSITDDFHNDLILSFANDVKHYMMSAGVDKEIVNDVMSIGCIAKGVSDLWNNDGKFSEIFYQRVIQLTYEKVDENV